MIFLECNYIVYNRNLGSIINGKIEHPLRFRITPDEYKRRMEIKITTRDGHVCRINEYRSAGDLDIIFEDGTMLYNKNFDVFSKGRIEYPTTPDHRKKNMSIESKTNRAAFCCYKNGAKRRGYVFDLEYDCFIQLIHSNCYYCGANENDNIFSNMKNYKRIGIDRKNNNIGYTKENCVPCCSICNRAKNGLDYTEWVNWIGRIANNYANLLNEDKS